MTINFTDQMIDDFFENNGDFSLASPKDREEFLDKLKTLVTQDNTNSQDLETNPMFLLPLLFVSGGGKSVESEKYLLRAYLEFHDEKLYPKNKFRDEPNQQNPEGQTVIHILIKSPELIETYQSYVRENDEKECDLNIPDKENGTPLSHAIAGNSLETIKYLEEFIPLQIENPIFSAIREHSPKRNRDLTNVCKYLHDAGVKIPTHEEIQEMLQERAKGGYSPNLDDSQNTLLSSLRNRDDQRTKSEETKRMSFAKKIFNNIPEKTRQNLLATTFKKNEDQFINHIKAYVPLEFIDKVEEYINIQSAKTNNSKWEQCANSIVRAIKHGINFNDNPDEFSTLAQNEAINNFNKLDLGNYLEAKDYNNIGNQVAEKIKDFKLFRFDKTWSIEGMITSTYVNTRFSTKINEKNLNKIADITTGMIAGVYNVNTIFTSNHGVPRNLLLAIQDAALKLHENGKLYKLNQTELQNLGKNIGKDLHGYLLKNKDKIAILDHIDQNNKPISNAELTNKIVDQAFQTMKDPNATKEVKVRSTLGWIKNKFNKVFTVSSTNVRNRNASVASTNNRSSSIGSSNDV